jgi:hypothetical protein
MTTVLNKNGNPVHDWAKPTFSRKTNRKNSVLWWSETGLGGSQLQKLREHMALLRPQLLALFESNRELLPKNSALGVGTCYGGWRHCPNHLADVVEAMIKASHAEFLAQGYSHLDDIK